MGSASIPWGRVSAGHVIPSDTFVVATVMGEGGFLCRCIKSESVHRRDILRPRRGRGEQHHEQHHGRPHIVGHASERDVVVGHAIPEQGSPTRSLSERDIPLIPTLGSVGYYCAQPLGRVRR